MNAMIRFTVVLPLVLVWGCSPQKKEDAGTNATPLPSTESTSALPETNAPVTPETGKTEATKKVEPKVADPKKIAIPTPPPLPPAIPEPGTAGFKPTTNNAVATLAAVDAQMKRMRDVEFVQLVQATYPAGRGTAEQISRIKDPKNLLLRYANFEPYGARYNLVGYIEIRKDGKSQTLVGEKYQPGHRAPSGNILETWPKNFSQHIVSNFGETNVNTLSALAQAAAKAGWKTAVETKKFDSGTFQRVILTSNSQPKRTYTVLLDPNKKLPIELQMDVEEAKKTRVTVSLRWLQSSKPLTSEDLDPKVKTAPLTNGGEMGKGQGT